MANLVETFIRHAEEAGFYLLAAQVRKDGEILGDWSRFPSKPRFETFSVSKTFAAVGVGIALEEGIITLDEAIRDSFPEESAGVTSEYALSLTVRDMLTMTAGLSEGMMWRDGYERKHEQDWVRYFYTHGKFDHKPGTEFLYNNACTYLLGALIQKKAGQNLREYLRHRLFEPIGIHNVEWGSCPMGRTLAANGLAINADELGNFGQLLAGGGTFNGRRIVSEQFVKDLMTPASVTGEMIPGEPPKNAGYGYQVWIDTDRRAPYMWGIFGQYCVVLPEKNAVVTVIGLDKHDGGSNGHYETSPIRQLIWDDLVTKV